MNLQKGWQNNKKTNKNKTKWISTRSPRVLKIWQFDRKTHWVQGFSFQVPTFIWTHSEAASKLLKLAQEDAAT